MRPRAELGLALGAAAAVLVAVAVRAFTAPGVGMGNPSRSSYETTPAGERAWVEALTLLRVGVIRWRRPTALLPRRAGGHAHRLMAVADPSVPLTSFEALELQQWSREFGDLLLAGPGTQAGMECFGWRITPIQLASGMGSVRAGGRVGSREISLDDVAAILVPMRRTAAPDSGGRADVGFFQCPGTRPARTDTLLRTPSGAPVALRLTYPRAGSVTLVADGRLFANEALRYTNAGEFALSLVVPRYDIVYLDEFHQGYRSGGTLLSAVLQWSRESPWGWALWQLAAVALVALAVAAVRFGPVLPPSGRQRRSPIEHVRALATALAAARGHDVAVRAMVGGLRRRLSRDGRPSREPVESWLAGLGERVKGRSAREAVATLQSLITPSQPAGAVLRAAYAVEDVWQELKP